MSSDPVVAVSGVSKLYEVYDNPRDRLKGLVLPALRNVIGLPGRSYCKHFSALSDVSFDVRQGETFGVVGRNGSGKSTLLQILCGTLAPTTGRVSVRGKVAALLELGAGFNPEFSGRENVYLNGRLFGLSKSQIDDRFDRIASFADIGDFIDRPVKTYSSGMYVRLAFAVIAHVDADILIVDEALSVGDAYFVQKCMRFLRDFMDRGTLLFVSHDTGAVLNLCSRALLLEKGRVRDIAEPKEIIKVYLEGLAAERQRTDSVVKTIESNSAIMAEVEDMRDRFVNSSNLRNDVQVFAFDPSAAGFGDGGATICGVTLNDALSGRPLSYVVGGELVALRIEAVANRDLEGLILGFDFKDRLGQTVFGDNTFLTYQATPCNASQGERVAASFTFRFPILPVGDYALTVALATGSQMSHVQHHWLHDALILKSQASRVGFGLVGIPMQRITIEVEGQEQASE